MNSSKPRISRISRLLMMTFLATGLGLTVYETMKAFLLPGTSTVPCPAMRMITVSFWPARRAPRLDPVAALRND